MTTSQHDSALQRLEVEVVERGRLRERHKAAIGTCAELGSFSGSGTSDDVTGHPGDDVSLTR